MLRDTKPSSWSRIVKKNAFSAVVNFQTAAMLASNETTENPKIYFLCYKNIIIKFGRGGGGLLYIQTHYIFYYLEKLSRTKFIMHGKGWGRTRSLPVWWYAIVKVFVCTD